MDKSRIFKPGRGASPSPVDAEMMTRRDDPPGFTPLIRPASLGRQLMPFISLDLFDFAGGAAPVEMARPRDGTASLTMVSEGELAVEDDCGARTIGTGSAEWLRAGTNAEQRRPRRLSPSRNAQTRGLTLELEFGPSVERACPERRLLRPCDIPRAGPAQVILGEHDGVRSPIPLPATIVYLLLTLQPGQAWTFWPRCGHETIFAALCCGTLETPAGLSAGDLIILDRSSWLTMRAAGDREAIFVIGSATT